jgi:hypothetical protein
MLKCDQGIGNVKFLDDVRIHRNDILSFHDSFHFFLIPTRGLMADARNGKEGPLKILL